jgi:hypothetical protein
MRARDLVHPRPGILYGEHGVVAGGATEPPEPSCRDMDTFSVARKRVPPPAMACRAFTARFMITCSSWVASTRRGASVC